jgi:threonine dehydrogenase-like Zn-dependent dehydrogenase
VNAPRHQLEKRVDANANDIHDKELIVEGEVDVAGMLTHEIPLEDAAEAFALAQSGVGIKVAVVP